MSIFLIKNLSGTLVIGEKQLDNTVNWELFRNIKELNKNSKYDRILEYEIKKYVTFL